MSNTKARERTQRKERRERETGERIECVLYALVCGADWGVSWVSSGLGSTTQKKLRGGGGGIFPRPQKTQRRSRSSHARAQSIAAGQPRNRFCAAKLVIGCSPTPPPRPTWTWASPSRSPACESIYSILSLALRDFHAVSKKRARSSTTCMEPPPSVGSEPRDNCHDFTTTTTLFFSSRPHCLISDSWHTMGAWVLEPIPVQSYQMPLLIHPLALGSHAVRRE